MSSDLLPRVYELLLLTSYFWWKWVIAQKFLIILLLEKVFCLYSYVVTKHNLTIIILSYQFWPKLIGLVHIFQFFNFDFATSSYSCQDIFSATCISLMSYFCPHALDCGLIPQYQSLILNLSLSLSLSQKWTCNQLQWYHYYTRSIAQPTTPARFPYKETEHSIYQHWMAFMFTCIIIHVTSPHAQ